MPAELATQSLASLGLASPLDFLDLPGEIVGGHPDRHVREVRVGGVTAFLKCEHRVRFRDRLRNGGASLSRHEGEILLQLEQRRLPAPPCLAFGELGGRAFVLVGAVPGVTLTRYDGPSVARPLGEATAEVHEAGFTTPDLSAKHVLIHDGRVTFLDWQRASRRRPTRRERVRTLAMLRLTAPSVDPSELLAAYREHCVDAPSWNEVEDEAARLFRRKGERLTRSTDAPRLVWLDGEAVCALADRAADAEAVRPHLYHGDNTVSRIALPSGRPARLVCRSVRWSLARVAAGMRGRNWRSPEMGEARRLIGTGRLIAFGQRPTAFGCESFILTEEVPA